MKLTHRLAVLSAFTFSAAHANAQTSEVAGVDAAETAQAAMESAANEEAASVRMVTIEETEYGNPDYPRDPAPTRDYWQAIQSADYPGEAYLAKAEGNTAFRLNIDANGAVTGCTITSSSGSAVLDQATCNLMQERAKFAPAYESEGNAVAGTFDDSYSWNIRRPQFSPPLLIEVAYTVDESGQTSDCEVLNTVGDMPRGFDREKCPGVNSGMTPPFRDEQGNPVTKRVVLKLEVREVEIDPVAD